MKQVKKPSKRPVVLAVNGRAASVVQYAEADAREGIRQGLEDVRKGRTRPAEEFFKEFEAKHDLSR